MISVRRTESKVVSVADLFTVEAPRSTLQYRSSVGAHMMLTGMWKTPLLPRRYNGMARAAHSATSTLYTVLALASAIAVGGSCDRKVTQWVHGARSAQFRRIS